MTEDWRKLAIGRPTDWGSAVARWDRFDTIHRQRGARYIDGSPVRFYAVRAVNDPQWAGAIRATTHRARPDRQHQVNVFTNRRFRVTPAHCATLTVDDRSVIVHDHTPERARERAISLARRDGLL